jgi:hypothetical protein
MRPEEKPYRAPGAMLVSNQRRCRNVYHCNDLTADAHRVAPLIKPLRAACVRCDGWGLLKAGTHIRECPTCEGNGGVWTCDDATINATITFLMTTDPKEYLGPTGRLLHVVGDRPYEPPPEDTP